MQLHIDYYIEDKQNTRAGLCTIMEKIQEAVINGDTSGLVVKAGGQGYRAEWYIKANNSTNIEVYTDKKHNFKLCYDSSKDKYYLDKENESFTFYGDWALSEYLRDEYDFNEEQIQEAISKIYQNN